VRRVASARTEPMTLFVLVSLLAVVLTAPLPARAAANDQYDHDPIEPANRKLFWFNDKLDTHVLVPVATAWDTITPKALQTSFSDFFINLQTPLVAINNLLQGKPAESASDVGRFVINTGLGFLGFLDPASRMGLKRHEEDFGQTLGRWGVPPGPYIVVPFLGPSDPRDLTGIFFDYPLAIAGLFVSSYVLLGPRLVDIINTRSLFLDEVRKAKEGSLDYYVFVRNAYMQHRKALIEDTTEVPHENEEDLYYQEYD